MGLIFFRGGELDGKAYETKDLLSDIKLPLPITEYKWTSEKITSPKTGNTAQVWKHISILDEKTDVASQNTPQSEPTGAAFVEARDAVAAYEESQAEASPELSSDVSDTAVGSDTPEPTPQPVQETPVASEGDLPSGEEILAKRKALKVSRGEVVERSGLAFSKLANIEQGTGKRVKPEEIRLYAETLDKIAAERGDASARS